jgi:hypothetical protein
MQEAIVASPADAGEFAHHRKSKLRFHLLFFVDLPVDGASLLNILQSSLRKSISIAYLPDLALQFGRAALFSSLPSDSAEGVLAMLVQFTPAAVQIPGCTSRARATSAMRYPLSIGRLGRQHEFLTEVPSRLHLLRFPSDF